jgi:hypothetical protein
MTVLETNIVTAIFWLNAKNQPRLLKCGLSATDSLKVLDENNTVLMAYDHEITTIPGNKGYARCEHELFARTKAYE